MTRTLLLLGTLWVGVLLGLCGCQSLEDEIAENETKAKAIIAALDLYQQTYGMYPDTLEELSPVFIYRVPLTADEEEFQYRNYDDSELGYRIAFSVNSNYGCGYEAKFEEWECSPDPE